MGCSDHNINRNTNDKIEDLRRSYFMMDLFKVIFAICVIAIHTSPLNEIKNEYILAFYNLLISLAVPFFFAVTGFLESKRFKDGDTKYIRKKYLKLYIIWCIAYIPLTIWGIVFEGDSFARTVWSFLRGFFFLGEQFCSWPLWYLLSIIYGSFVIELVIKKRQTVRIMILGAIILYVLAIVLNHAGEINPHFGKAVAFTVGNGRLLTGPAFMLIGMAVKEWKDNKKKLKMPLLPIIGGGTVVCIVSVILRLPYSTTYLPSVFIVLVLLLICIKESDKTRDETKKYHAGLILRDYSKVAYFTHMYFVFLFQYSVLKFMKVREQGIGCFAVTVVGTIILFGVMNLVDFIGKKIIHRRTNK